MTSWTCAALPPAPNAPPALRYLAHDELRRRRAGVVRHPRPDEDVLKVRRKAGAHGRVGSLEVAVESVLDVGARNVPARERARFGREVEDLVDHLRRVLVRIAQRELHLEVRERDLLRSERLDGIDEELADARLADAVAGSAH